MQCSLIVPLSRVSLSTIPLPPRYLVVVINKMDDHTVKWSKERYNECVTKIRPFLRQQCGYAVKKEVKFIPISGLSGANVKTQVREGRSGGDGRGTGYTYPESTGVFQVQRSNVKYSTHSIGILFVPEIRHLHSIVSRVGVGKRSRSC